MMSSFEGNNQIRKYKDIEYLIFDVNGTLTDGGIFIQIVNIFIFEK